MSSYVYSQHQKCGWVSILWGWEWCTVCDWRLTSGICSLEPVFRMLRYVCFQPCEPVLSHPTSGMPHPAPCPDFAPCWWEVHRLGGRVSDGLKLCSKCRLFQAFPLHVQRCLLSFLSILSWGLWYGHSPLRQATSLWDLSPLLSRRMLSFRPLGGRANPCANRTGSWGSSPGGGQSHPRHEREVDRVREPGTCGTAVRKR